MSAERNCFFVDRSIWSHELFEGEPFDRMKAWLWLLSQAVWAERTVRGQGGPIVLSRGQLSHSVRYMGEAWSWDKSRVSRFLDMLEKRDMIQRKTETGQLVLTICNYEDYQLTPGYKRDTSETAVETGPRQDRDRTETNKNQEIKKSYTPPTPSRGMPPAAADAAAPLAAEEEISIEAIDRLVLGEPSAPAAEPAKPTGSIRDVPLDKLYALLKPGGLPATPGKAAGGDPIEAQFAEVWAAYPRREGDNPRKPALAAYRKARKAGAAHETILAGVRALAAKWRGEPKERRQYIPLASTWLNQERWSDGPVNPAPAADVAPDDIDEETWDLAVYSYKTAGQWAAAAFGPRPVEPGCRAPLHILDRYGYKAAA